MIMSYMNKKNKFRIPNSEFRILALAIALGLLTGCADGELISFVNAGDITEVSYGDCTMTPLHVEGKYLMDENNQITNLHGFAQTYQPYYNESAWDNYDIDECLAYNQRKIVQMLAAGWEVTFVRQHMDPYWCAGTSEDECHVNMDWEAFEYYLDKVYIPMAKFANSHGIYVLMRPPGVFPAEVTTGDAYNEYLIKVWDIVSSHPDINCNPGIMFEIGNEPVNIEGTDGSMGGTTLPQYKAMQEYLQPIVDVIRANGANNVCWLPGMGYQSYYAGFTTHVVEGENIGFAVHCYPGWYGSDAIADSGEGQYSGTNGGYASFQSGWDEHFGDTPNYYPIIITEMDWSNGNVYYTSNGDGTTSNWTWGQGVTGEAGGDGFGANFKYITDNMGNVSYLTFTGQEHLVQVDDNDPEDGKYTFYNDLENSNIRTMYNWYKEYAGKVSAEEKGEISGLAAYINGKAYKGGDEMQVTLGNTGYIAVYANYSKGASEVLSTTAGYKLSTADESILAVNSINRISGISNGRTTLTVEYNGVREVIDVEVSSFPLDGITAGIYGANSYNSTTHTLVTQAYGYGGWQYSDGVDLSDYQYMVFEFCKGTNISGQAQIRIYDENNYWTTAAGFNIDDYRVIIDMKNQELANDEEFEPFDPSHIYMVGFWTTGGESSQVIINQVYVTNDAPSDEYDAPEAITDGDAQTGTEEEDEEWDGYDYNFTLSALDPTIWNTNNFNSKTGVLNITAYGFAGWHFSSAVNLSYYKYLVIETDESSNLDSIYWRMFDEDSYWGSPSNTLVTENTQVIELKNMDIVDDYNEGYREQDMTHIYYAGFWAGGDRTITIKEIYATNNLSESNGDEGKKRYTIYKK